LSWLSDIIDDPAAPVVLPDGGDVDEREVLLVWAMARDEAASSRAAAMVAVFNMVFLLVLVVARHGRLWR
jgi:hypothetical protein